MSVKFYHTSDISGRSFLVTGGAGFIGSHLVRYLLACGAGKVRVMDNLSTGRSEHLDPFVENPAFEFFRADVGQLSDCLTAVKGIDFVLHQAALGSVPRSLENPLATHESNVTGTLNIFFAAQKAGVKKVVYASSSSVYGDHPALPKCEPETGNPLSPYAAGKQACEQYGFTFWKNYQLPTVGLRYFNVFGPQQNAHSAYAAVIPLFAKAVLKGLPPVIHGDGSQARDFTYIDNVVQANIKALFADHNASGETFNIGNGGSTTVAKLAEKMIALSGQKITPTHAPPRKGDVKYSLADISKAKKILGYRPEVSFEEGITRAFAWYEKNL